MPRCALNADTDSPDDWEGKDVDVWYARWKIKVRHWFAFANRCPSGITWTLVFFPLTYLFPFTVWFTGLSWWYLFPVIIIPVARKWRPMPKVLFAIKGDGPWRMENHDSWLIEPNDTPVKEGFYLSRIQTWTRWHFAIQWPLLISLHWYWYKKAIPLPGDIDDTDETLVNMYRGWHRDEDEIYWGDGGFFGVVWK